MARKNRFEGNEVEVEGRTVALSSLDKIFFPDAGLTKGDLIAYYRDVAPTMVPHMRGRAISMHRFPDGIDGEDFYQKNVPDYFPDWIRSETVSKEGGEVEHVVCDDAATLVYLANQACITPHVWLSRVDRLRRPDRMVFDLDPSDSSLERVRFAARKVRVALEELGFVPYLMTTGSRGFHVWVPLERKEDFDTVRAFAHDLAKVLASRHPDRLTVEQRKNKRGDRVFLDYLRNGYAQTAVTPYAVRARPGAPVATPIDWDELPGMEPRRYTIENLSRRLAQKDDPWADMDDDLRPLGPARATLDEWLKEAG